MPFIFAIAEIASQQQSWRLYGASPLILSLSQRSTCNLALSAKKRPYRSFTHHPRKTTFFKRLLVKYENDSFRSIGSTIRRFLLTNISSDLFIPIVALLSPHPSFVSYFLTASFLLRLPRSIVLKRSFTRQKSLVSPDPVGALSDYYEY